MNRRQFIQSLAATMLVASSMRLAHAVDLAFLRDALPVYFSCRDAKGESVIVPMTVTDNGDAVHEFTADELDERLNWDFDLEGATLHINGEVEGPFRGNRWASVCGAGSTLTVIRPSL